MIEINSSMHRVAQECIACHSLCLETLDYCLERGGEFANVEHLRILRDCAEICLTNAHFLQANSYFHLRTSAVCAEICDTCAIDCRQIEDDARLKACAEACQHCAESCRRISSLLAA